MNETQSIPNYSSKFTSAFELKSEKQIQKEQQKKKRTWKIETYGFKEHSFPAKSKER